MILLGISEIPALKSSRCSARRVRVNTPSIYRFLTPNIHKTWPESASKSDNTLFYHFKLIQFDRQVSPNIEVLPTDRKLFVCFWQSPIFSCHITNLFGFYRYSITLTIDRSVGWVWIYVVYVSILDRNVNNIRINMDYIVLICFITDQSEHEKTISVLLNGVESTVEILDVMDVQVLHCQK